MNHDEIAERVTIDKARLADDVKSGKITVEQYAEAMIWLNGWRDKALTGATAKPNAPPQLGATVPPAMQGAAARAKALGLILDHHQRRYRIYQGAECLAHMLGSEEAKTWLDGYAACKARNSG